MNALREIVTGGDIALAACAILIVELAVMVVGLKRPWRSCMLAVLPGAFLLLALWSALAGHSWAWTALLLALSLPSHLLDLWSRRP